MSDDLDAGDAFFKHLDECARCRDRPFDLCSRGAELLKKAANDAVSSVGAFLR